MDLLEMQTYKTASKKRRNRSWVSAHSPPNDADHDSINPTEFGLEILVEIASCSTSLDSPSDISYHRVIAYVASFTLYLLLLVCHSMALILPFIGSGKAPAKKSTTTKVMLLTHVPTDSTLACLPL